MRRSRTFLKKVKRTRKRLSSSPSLTRRGRVFFVLKLSDRLRTVRRRILRRRTTRRRKGKALPLSRELRRRALRAQVRRPPPSLQDQINFGSGAVITLVPRVVTPVEQSLIALRSGTLSLRYTLSSGQRVQGRNRAWTTKSFAVTYASMAVALWLPGDLINCFPDNYCLRKSFAKGWYLVVRQPSIRASRKITRMGIEDPRSVISSLAHTVRELQRDMPAIFCRLMHLTHTGKLKKLAFLSTYRIRYQRVPRSFPEDYTQRFWAEVEAFEQKPRQGTTEDRESISQE